MTRRQRSERGKRARTATENAVRSINIDQDLLVQYLDELALCGAVEGGGCYRPLYGSAWTEACIIVTSWMEGAGLVARRDEVGNLWGRLSGTEENAKAVVTGSHIDTVRGGGRLDGALGVVGGLLALTALKEAAGAPRKPLELLVTCEEEGSRFRTNFWGARAVLGTLTAQEAEEVEDDDGITLAGAMAQHGLDHRKVDNAARNDLDAFVELHIEQGGVLEHAGNAVGVVTTIVGGKFLRITVTGQSDHAGTTPMDLRNDALVGAAEMIQAVERCAKARGAPAVATVGRIAVEPSQVNVVPGAATFTVDLRHGEGALLEALETEIRDACTQIATRRGLEIEIVTRHARPPVAMNPDIISKLEEAAADEGAEPLRMVSGAGHDAQILAACCKVGMLFVPSIGGRSHCPDEATSTADLMTGVKTLARALYTLAY